MLDVKDIFPYDAIREGQKDLIDIVREVSAKGGHAVLEGCNGLGKTVGLLSGIIPSSLASDHPIVYLARTHKQIDRVMSELKLIAEKVAVKGVSLRGRREMCFNSLVAKYCPDPRSAMDVCKELQKMGKCIFYENLEGKHELYEQAERKILSKPLSSHELLTVCRDLKVCPYEISKKLLPDVNIVAANYLYLFSPSIKDLFLNNLNRKLSDLIVVLDEAHNVPGMALNISSDSLSKSSIKLSVNEAEKYKLNDIKIFSKKMLKIYEELEPLIGEQEEILVPKYFVEERLEHEGEYSDIGAFLEDMHDKGEMIQRLMISEGKYPHSHIHRLSEFIIYWMDTGGKREYCQVLKKYFNPDGGDYSKIEVLALDPRKITKLIYSQAYATINVSGTIEPIQAFIDLVGLPSSTVQRVLKSPFNKKNVLALIVEGVSTALAQRVKSNYDKIIEKIVEVVDSTPANTGIFTASYSVLKDLVDNRIEDRLSKKLFLEEQNSSSKENDRLIRNFKRYKDLGGGVLLGVMGGRNSEGEDFPGDEMNSVIVVGVPYAKPSPSVKASIRYYDEQFPGKGREYGYVIPSMRRAMQAGGRTIRKLTDRGAIIFLDWRFKQENCLKYFPNWLKNSLEVIPDRKALLRLRVSDFFKEGGRHV